jgi:hypothetical protein
LIASIAVAIAGCGGGSSNSSDHDQRAQVRAAAEAYQRALGRGDGLAACKLLSHKGLADGGYKSLASCAREHSDVRALGRFHVVKVTIRSGGRSADAEINDAPVSDSGNDSIGLGRYGDRWLIDAG